MSELKEEELDLMARTGPTACLSCPRAAAQIRELRRYATQLEAENERLMGIVEGQDANDNLPSLRAEIRELRNRLEKYDADATKLNNTFVTIRRKLESDNARLRKVLDAIQLYALAKRDDAVEAADYHSINNWRNCAVKARNALKEPDDEN